MLEIKLMWREIVDWVYIWSHKVLFWVWDRLIPAIGMGVLFLVVFWLVYGVLGGWLERWEFDRWLHDKKSFLELWEKWKEEMNLRKGKHGKSD